MDSIKVLTEHGSILLLESEFNGTILYDEDGFYICMEPNRSIYDLMNDIDAIDELINCSDNFHKDK